MHVNWYNGRFSSTGGNPSAGTGGRREEEGDHESLPEHPDRHPGSDRAAEWAEHEAVSGEHGARRETEKHHWSVRAPRGGKNHIKQRGSTGHIPIWVVKEGTWLIRKLWPAFSID